MVQGNGCLPSGNRSLTETMLTQVFITKPKLINTNSTNNLEGHVCLNNTMPYKNLDFLSKRIENIMTWSCGHYKNLNYENILNIGLDWNGEFES